MNNSHQTEGMHGAKRQKMETPSQSAVEVAPNEGSSTTLLDLYVDCFEELFEFLTKQELLVLRQTCKRLKSIVDYYIKEFSPVVRIGSGKIELDPKKWQQYDKLDAVEVKMIKHAVIRTDNFRVGQRAAETDQFLSVKNVEQILGQIETLDIDFMGYQESDFYDRFLKFCPNLKKISISEIDTDRNCGTGWEFNWLLQRYPKLEQIDLKLFVADCTEAHYDVPEFERFLELNESLQVFTVDSRVVVESDSYLDGLSVDQLNLKVETRGYLPGIDEVVDLAEHFFVQGCYKRLHIYGFHLYQAAIDEILTLSALEKLYFGTGTVGTIKIDQRHTGLKELAFGENVQIENSEEAESNLPNLERIHFKAAEIQSIMPFISHFTRVKKIRIDEIKEGAHFKNGVIDVVALNSAREQRDRASKLIVYVCEDVFLATKWAAMPTECSLVELKRHTAIEWDHIEMRPLKDEGDEYRYSEEYEDSD